MRVGRGRQLAGGDADTADPDAVRARGVAEALPGRVHLALRPAVHSTSSQWATDIGACCQPTHGAAPVAAQTARYGARVSAPAPSPAVSGTRALRLIGLGALVGVPAALVAALFIAVVHELQHLLWHDLPERLGTTAPPWYLVLGLPLLGACIVLVARTRLPGDGGHGPLGGISVEPTSLAHGPGVALAALGTLPFGAVLGPEAPLIALGSVTAAVLVPATRLDERERGVLSLAGSFSAISALFGGPLVAGMLLLEAGVGLGPALIPFLIPGSSPPRSAS